MREVAEKSVGWLVLGGIVLAVLVAKKRYENKFAAAIAAADANARAEVRNELGIGQNVNVAVDASHNRGAVGHQCDDLYSCPICAPIALRVLMAADRSRPSIERSSASVSARVDYDYDDDTAYDAAVVGETGGSVGNDGGSGARGRGPGGHVRDSGGVEVVPCASVNPSSPLSDLLARPWAYDEADPRCEVNRA